jgi:predicted ATP-grasp superfamily ATP-dependent carboligase
VPAARDGGRVARGHRGAPTESERAAGGAASPAGCANVSAAASLGIDTSTPAFVLGMFDTGLAIVRALAPRGVRVRGFDPDPHQPGFFSRYGTAYRCPDPAEEPTALLRVLLDAAAREGRRPVLYPTSDPFVLFLARHCEPLARAFVFAIPPPDQLEALVDKRRQYALAEQLGIPLPPTFGADSPDEVERIAKRLPYPVLIKPRYGHLWRQHFGGDSKGLPACNVTELRAAYRRARVLGLDVLIQEIIPGPVSDLHLVDVYVDGHGRALGTMVAQKIRQYPTDFGVGTLIESVCRPAVAAQALRVCEAFGYRGLAEIEFKLDRRDGAWKLIEINPRAWQQIAHGAACGIDFALLQYLDVTGQQPASRSRFRCGLKWMNEVNDLRAAVAHARRGEVGVRGWLASLHGVRAFTTFDPHDPWPTVRAPLARRLGRPGPAYPLPAVGIRRG